MAKLFVILATLAGWLANAADKQPLLVVLELDPSSLVANAESPMFAIYDDGTEICENTDPEQEATFVQRKISDPQKEVETLLGFDPLKMDKFYELSSSFDENTTVIWTPQKRIHIYGDWRKPPAVSEDDKLAKKIDARERQMWKTLPSGIRSFLSRVERERNKPGESWLPDNIELIFWPYEYAPEESIVWPAEWPDLNSESTRKRGKDSYRVILPVKLFGDAKRFLSTRNRRGAVLINGKKMAVFGRFPFPSEEKWMK